MCAIIEYVVKHARMHGDRCKYLLAFRQLLFKILHLGKVQVRLVWCRALHNMHHVFNQIHYILTIHHLPCSAHHTIHYIFTIHHVFNHSEKRHRMISIWIIVHIYSCIFMQIRVHLHICMCICNWGVHSRTSSLVCHAPQHLNAQPLQFLIRKIHWPKNFLCTNV